MNSTSNILFFKHLWLGGILSPDFVSQVSNHGILGAIPSGYLNLDQTHAFIEEVKKKTSHPFSLNLFVDYGIYDNQIQIKKHDEIIAIEQTYDKDSVSTFCIPPQSSMNDLIELVIDCAVPVVSTTFGLLQPHHVTMLKTAGIKIMTTINCIYELKIALKTQQPDVLIYQNIQAGGHKGGSTSLPHSGEEIIEFIKKYDQTQCTQCVLAGGIVTKQDIEVALSKGFDGVQIGTAFLATQGSNANEEYQMAILENTETAFTTSITGRPARGITNRLARLAIQENLSFSYITLQQTYVK